MKNTELEIGNNYFLDTAKEITSTEKFIYFGIVIFFCIIGFGLLFRKKRK
jgi:cell division protein FtsL